MANIAKNKKMTKKNISTSNSILLVPVIKISFIMVIFYYEILGTLFFEGSNITDFLN